MLKWIAATLIAVAALTGAPGVAHAAGPAPDLQKLVDDYVTDAMREEKVPGVAVTVVADGKKIFSKGYGFADTRTKTPVDPDRTGFLIGSETKLLTAQAALQLVAQGKLDLDVDVNTYLKAFKIEDTYPGRPVTLRHLLTHTGGFDEDYMIGTGSDDPDDIEPLGRVLAATQPLRKHPPGTAVTYDNYGVALAGYLVEVASGQPYADYVKEHVFDPLGMTNSTVAVPRPRAIEDNLATPYTSSGEATDLTYGNLPPTGMGPVSTASDMGRYMIAQLSGRGVAAQMTLQQYTEDPRLPGMGFIFEEHLYQGHRMLWKGGDVLGMHAFMFLLPERNMGVHIISNGDGLGGDGVDGFALAHEIADRYLPQLATPNVEPLAGATSERFEGWYSNSRTSRGSILKFKRLLKTPLRVEATPDGGITFVEKGKRTSYIQVEPGMFQKRGGWDRIVFKNNGVMAIGNNTVVFDRLGPLDHPWLHLGLLAFGVVVLLATLIWIPFAAAVRRTRSGSSWPARSARLLAWVTAAVVTGFAAGFALLAANQDALLYAIVEADPSLMLPLAMASLAVPLAACLVAFTVAAWWKGWWRVPGRIGYTTITLGAVSFATFAVTYNVVGPPFT